MPSGSSALVTAYKAGATASSYDVDGGTTTVQSPAIDLSGNAGQKLTFRYYFAHRSNASSADELRVSIVADGGAATTVLLERGAANDDDAAWASASIPLDAWAGTTIRIRFHVSACDGRSVEGALVYATPTPYQQFSATEQPTAADGWAVLTMRQLRYFPASNQQQLLVVFVRARKSGEDLLAGISTRRLVSFTVNLRG